VLFSFKFKKRPLDAPESDWPVDTMGFTLDRPNGKHVAFRFDRKARPAPPQGPEQPTGLGRGTMEFVSSRPDRGDFRFTWNRNPPGEAPPEGKQTEWPPDPERSRQ
ncbi:MAG: hypothetical protein GWO24_36390, partial [Akkermansiaceae bacterium]|nr:hypothetical protein [Akkermansiaceae bacterium]